MSRDFVHTICAPLPGAEKSDPWGGGHDAWKVAGKMFACIGSMDQGVAVKTADIDFATMMIEAGDALRAPYFHKSWVLLPWGTDEALMRDRLIVSYDIVRAGLTKKVQAGLAERE
jgi:predicted DNA-binding protein (MmcQ/YjbR family)